MHARNNPRHPNHKPEGFEALQHLREIELKLAAGGGGGAGDGVDG